MADDDILPVHRGALREWFVEFMTRISLGEPPTPEEVDWFVHGVESCSLVKIREMEQEDFLVEEALRQAAGGGGYRHGPSDD